VRQLDVDRDTRTVHLEDGLSEALVVRSLSKSFGHVSVLKGVELEVPRGSIVALLGPSGCGKTTLLRCIAGLERPDSGEVRVAHSVHSGPGRFVPPEDRRIGMVFQDLALFPHLSVGRNVAFGRPRGDKDRNAVGDALGLVGLAELVDRMPSTLSGGQQQRVALARAIANGPAVILMDEPFSNLDAALRGQIRLEIQRLLSDLGVTTLFVTHDQEEAFILGDSVAVMFDGAIVQHADPAELYEAPATRRVAEFIGDANLIDAVASDHHADTRIGRIPLRSGGRGRMQVMVRPEEVVLDDGADAVIEAVEFYGHDAVYIVRMADGTKLRARVLSTPRWRAGDRVRVGYSGRATVAFSGQD
jgi:iron(III) transport system ATP-binding protein